MRCPYCKEDDDRVVNSRASADGVCVKRRRECGTCGRRYTTYERVEFSPLRIVKKDGNREAFSREKLLGGLMKACHKRPVSTENLESVVEEIERELRERFDNEVPSDAVGELVMARLRELDQVAYIRFASVYREFKDVSDFAQEAAQMLEKRGSRRETRPENRGARQS
jgi:transcriptional repressor NrdR